jgi:hypothetical protein
LTKINPYELSVYFEKKSVLVLPLLKFENSIASSGYQLNTVLGGRYRSKPIKKRFFYDLDWQPGFRKYN